MAVVAGAQQVQIEIADLWSVGIGIMGDVLAMTIVQPDQPIVLGNVVDRAAPPEEIASPIRSRG
jgi:hypothetical protein